RCKLQF
ncbi:hypothetical protein D030_3805B, partial [Vibrio parahaemolyticus AQ3810]